MGGFCEKGPGASPCQTQSVSARSTMDPPQDLTEPVRQAGVASEERYSRKGKNAGQREKGETRVRLQWKQTEKHLPREDNFSVIL